MRLTRACNSSARVGAAKLDARRVGARETGADARTSVRAETPLVRTFPRAPTRTALDARRPRPRPRPMRASTALSRVFSRAFARRPGSSRASLGGARAVDVSAAHGGSRRGAVCSRGVFARTCASEPGRRALASGWVDARALVVTNARGRPKSAGRGGGGRGKPSRKFDVPDEVREFNDDTPMKMNVKKKEKVVKVPKAEVTEQERVMLSAASGFEDYDDGAYGDGDADEDVAFEDMGTRELELADQGRGATVKNVEFVQACASLAGCPPPTLPEIAVIGRSNVGKSSLVNMLTNRKSLAKTSKNPGKTQTINHYRMTTGEGKFYLVDLPGYGFANAPEHLREKWAEFTREYLTKRESLITVLLLIDSTVKPQRLDLECLDWLGEAGVPVTIVFTKVDKKRKKGSGGTRVNPQENVEEFCREVSEYWDELPPMLYTSAVNAEGKRDVLNHIATLRQFFKKPLKENKLVQDAIAAGAPAPLADEDDADEDAFDDDDDDEIETFDDEDIEDDWN